MGYCNADGTVESTRILGDKEYNIDDFICIIKRNRIRKVTQLRDLMFFSSILEKSVKRYQNRIILEIEPQLTGRLIKESQKEKILGKLIAVLFLKYYRLSIKTCFIILHLGIVRTILGLRYIPSTAELSRFRRKHKDVIERIWADFIAPNRSTYWTRISYIKS